MRSITLFFLLTYPALLIHAQKNTEPFTWLISLNEISKLTSTTEKNITSLTVYDALTQQQKFEKSEYWQAGSPGYRWSEITFDLIAKNQRFVEGNRIFALLHLAIYDATMAAEKINTTSYFITSSSAASNLLAHLFPKDSAFIIEKGHEAVASKLWSKNNTQKEIETGYAVGKYVAEKYIAYAKKDGSFLQWDGIIPAGDNTLWHGKDPMYPTLGKWKTWVIDSGNIFRPAPLPPDFAKTEMEILKNTTHTFDTDKTAFFWAAPVYKIWFDIASKKIFEYHLDDDPPAAAKVYALLYVALFDAQITAWDAKYTYWYTRPDVYDPTFKPLIRTPNFPGYPSGHSTTGASAATILGYLFPADKNYFEALSQEGAMSRLYGGIHFNIDNTTGMEMGKKVGNEIVKFAEKNFSKN
ncbi:MAG: vanadium-dependent haloperoxidase [Fimbriimonadaceae bacterium]|nr:vanadium-dependent haloperoxidase [Chitinophagales bacterium]